jgi:hypothetical protein
MSGTFRKQFTTYAAANLSAEALSARLAGIARQGVADLIASGQASGSYTTTVDGREGADESTVSPLGVIVHRWNRIGAAATFALAFLRERSPIPRPSVKPASNKGDATSYRDSFYFGLDGAYVPAPQFTEDAAAGVRELVIGNWQPFNRKVDVQMAGGRKITFSTDPGLFDDAAKAVRRRFPELNAKRVYTMKFTGQHMRGGTGAAPGKGGRPSRAVESPALIISPRD